MLLSKYKNEVRIIDMDAITVKDIIFILLAVAGLTGVSIYSVYKAMMKAVAGAVAEKTMLLAKELHYRTMATTKAHVGYVYWNNYMKTKDRKDLDGAIDLSERAYVDYASQLNEQEPDNEELICWIKNNLAYYLAERQNLKAALPGDDVLAQQFAKYAYDRISKYPKDRGTYTDTYRFVQKQFP